MTPPKPLSSTQANEFDRVLEELVADRGIVGWRAISNDYEHQLTSAEAKIVEQAGAKRRAEFATGRSLLRALLNADVELLRAPTGAPIVPRNVVGSLTHDDAVAVAVVAPSRSQAAVGIDVEVVTELSDDIADIVVRDDDIVPDPLTAFVTKEAAYKAWSVLGGPMLEHHDVRVVVDANRYRATMAGSLVLHGEFGFAAGRVVACVFSPATRTPAVSRSTTDAGCTG